MNPSVYAIWDSRVCRFLTGNSYAYKVENIERYWSYLDLCERVCAEPLFQLIHEKHQAKVGFEITKMRTVEQIMFISSDKPLDSSGTA